MRKSSRARLFSTCLTGAILAAASPAWGQTSDAPTWKPRAEVDAQVGKDIGVSTSLFAPIAQNDSSLVYIDGRIGYDQRFDRNGSATIGARVRVGEDAAIGVNAGADFYRSDIGSRDQAAVSMGLEGFTSVFDARVNYRLPLSKTRTIGYIDPAASGSAALVLENNRLIERHSGFRLEAVPLQGFSGEAGVRLPVGGNASIRGSVGGFTYWDKDADENYRGIRGGLEMDIEDRNSGARFTFGGTVEHDNRFGTDARATVRLSVPFGGRSGDRGAAPTGLDRQMGDRVRRDYVARSGSRYRDLTTSRFAVDARTGNEFGGFYYASGTGVAGAAGTLATPTTINDAVTRAGANGVVVALGSGGNITTPGVTLATNQYLLGGAGAVDVRLLNGGTTQFALGGTNGVIVGSNAAGATVTLGQGSVVRDVTIRGAGTGIAANGVGGFAIDRVIVENTGGAGISLTNTLGSVALTGLTVRGGAGAGVLVNGGSSVSLANSTISGGAGAVDINDGGANLAVSLSGLTLSATGGNVLDIDGSGAGTVTVTGLSGITIRGGTGETGGLSVRSATFDANTTTAGIQTVNAGRMEVGTTAARVNGQGMFLTDVIGSLSFTDLDIANSGATGLHVVNSKVNSFTLATLDGTIDTVGGTAADLDPLVIDLNFASISSVGAAGPGVILNTVQGGGTGGNALTIGTLTISNSGGDGLVILNSTGLVRVNGGAITNSGGSSVRIGAQGVAGSGGSTNLLFGASITDPTGTAAIVAIFNTSGTLNFTGPISGRGPILVQDTLAGSAISFGAITLTGTAGDAITLGNLGGSINFAGLVTIANPGANGIVIGNVPGGVTFGNVDITGLGNFTGLDVTGAHGNVLFNTLDITGTGGGKGIDVTGSTNAGNVIVLNGSIIQGVNIGVDLTQANMTGQFRFGDGNPVPLNSTIAANTPIVIALMNASNGSYNFADANLVGDTSNLTGAGFTAYYARVGATGAGTRSDPGSLAGADASNAQYIVLLNDSAGGQDVFDAASAGGSFDLAAGQSLVSFLNGDFIAVSGAGLPANLTVSGIGPAGITNVYAGSGAAMLTTTTAGSATVNLSNNSRIDGLVIRNAGNDVGVEGVGVSGVTIANSDIGGSAGAIAINDGGAAASVTLTHLDLSSSAGTTLSLSGAGAGTLTVSASDVDIAATGTSAAASLTDLNSGGIAFGTISTGVSAGSALTLQGVTGGGVTIGSVAVGGTGAGAGVVMSGNGAAVTVGAISVAGSAGDAIALSGNSGSVALGALSLSGAAGAGLNLQNTLGNVAVGIASISGGAAGVSINGVSAGSAVAISGLTVTGSGTGVTLADIDGAVLFIGTTSISNPGTSGIVIGAGSAGTISFGDVDITGLGAGTTGVYARDASGTVNFHTLDITGSSTTGTRGIDLTGATFATNFTTTESGSITGVGIGVDLTNAAITGSFRYGDGSNTDADGAASSINAVTPIVITGINVGTGSYNFLDVALTGDTSTLTSSATLYFVKAGATGVGTIADPGSLAGAEASAADTIILLNDPTGGQDILDAAGAGGSFDLAAGRKLLSFLNGDTLTLPGGAPANLLLFGIPSGQIGNPFAGSGAPVLTTTLAGTNTVMLGGGNVLDGLIIGSGVNGIGVVGNGVANITIRNSNISGPGGAIALSDAGLNASVALSNLTLSSTGGIVALFDGTGAGTLAITQLNGITIQGGNGETDGFYADGVLFDADLATAGTQGVIGSMTIGAAGARVDGTGLTVNASDGSLDFVTLDVVNANDVGVVLTGNTDLTAIVRAGSIDTLGGDALVGVNAALTLDFGSIVATDGGIFMIDTSAATVGQPVLNVAMLDLTDGGLLLAGSGDYVFANASITDSVGIAVLLNDAANLDYSGDITSSLGASATLAVISHTGTASFHGGTIDVTDGAGFQFIDADGTYSFTGTATLHGGDAGIHVANGSSGNFSFGAGTSVTNGAVANFMLENSDANVTYLGSLTQGLNTDNFVVLGQTGGVVDFSQATISASAGTGLLFLGANGTSMLGDVQLSGDAGIAITGSSGTISFGNVDITAVAANQTAVDLTGALGNVTFQTLDIAGASTVGTKGIDLTGSTTAANIIVNESSSITGVGIGVDLTNAAITGNFRYGDGSNVDADGAASTISAVTPLVIAGLNPGGTYDFRDVVLTGDTTSLQTNKTVFWVQAGATGAGTRADPGSLAAAEASGVDVIILLDAAGAGQDVIDAASAGGGLDLVANQSLLSFLGGDTLSLGGGAPANLLLYGIAGGSVTNPYAGSGAPLLTTSQVGATTVNLAAGALIDGVQIGNLDAKGVYGGYLADVTIRNSVIFGGVNAIEIVGNGGSAALSNLDLSSATGDVLRLRGDGGNLIVTQLANVTIRGGTSGRGLFGEQLVFDASVATAGIQTVTGALTIGSSASRVGGSGLVLDDVTGTLSLIATIFNTNGDGIFADGGAGGFTFATTGGTIDTGLVTTAGSALNLANLSADLQLDSVTYAGLDSGVLVNNVTGVGTGGRALNVDTLTVASGADSGISLLGTTSGNFSFGSASSITGTTVAGIELANTGTGVFNYAGSVTGITAGALVSVSNGDIGNAVFSGTLSATGGIGLQFDNADGFYTFGGTTTLNGGDAGIDIVNGSGGSFLFEPGTSIISPSGTGMNIQGSTADVHYRGSITFATAGQAALNVADHSGGTIMLTGALNVTNGTGLQFSNADGAYHFSGATLNGGDAGIDIVNGSGGEFIFGGGFSITSPSGIGINVADSTAKVSYWGSLTYATVGTAAISVLNHSTGTISIGSGGSSFNVSGGTGLQFDNADGTYEFVSTTTLNGGDAGIDIVNGSAGNFTFGSGTSITSPSGVGIDIQNSTAAVTYSGNLTYATAGQAAVHVSTQAAGSLNLQTATLSVSGGTGLSFDNADGTYQFGALALAGGARIAVLNGSAGTFTFGDVDVTGLGSNQTAVNLTGATGNVTFNTLDIAGTSTVGSKGIDLTSNTGTGDIVVTNSSTISGVGVGVDLTNASRPGLFQYGDGESAIDVASTITATTPLVVTGLNGGTGTYNFADVNLVGDTSGLATTATVYYVLAGASGSGTLGDPGSLAGAEAAAADIIILLNNPAGGQDVLDTLGSNGNDTLQLDVNQALRSFLNGDTITLPGGAPANVILTGVVTGQVTNPYAGSGAPILTTTGAANTVTLANNSLIDGVMIQSASGFAGVYGSGVSTVTLSSSTLFGAGGGLSLLDGGAAASATLTGLTVSVTSSSAAFDLSGAGAGTLTVTGSGLDVTQGGSGQLVSINDIAIGAGGLSFGTTTATASGGGVDLLSIAGVGSLSFTSIALNGATGAGVLLQGSSAAVDLGNVTVAGATGAGIELTSNSGAITLGTVNVSGSATGIAITGQTNTLAVGDGTIAGASVAGILFGAGNTGTITFGNVDITGLQTGARGVDARNIAAGDITFATLDISAASAVGTRGIDVTGNAGVGDFVVTNSSVITGVGIGVDLTNASRPGLFQYGDGSLPANSTISATTPILITGLNSGIGTYNFIDVNLVGDTSGLATSATVYYVLAGATGSGTLGDPGSLAGAEAAAADIIILLNNPAGGQDVLDALGSNGNDTLQLDVNQALRSFLNGDTITLPGGAPANVLLTGVVTGQVTNPYAGSGAPILTTTGAANTVTLANNSLIDGVVIQSASGFAGVYGSGVSTITLSNATLSGSGTALRLLDGGAAATATLTNLSLSASGGSAAVDFSGAGAGSLTLTGSGLNVSHSGSGSLLTIADIVVGGANLSFGTVASTASGAGVDLGTVAGLGTLGFGSITVAGASGSGVALHDSSAVVNLGDVTVSGAAGAGIQLTSNSGATTIGTVDISSSATGIAASGLTSTLTVGDGTIDGATTAGILIGAGNTVLLSFGNIDITALQTGARGVDARLTGGGNVYFETLDISGASATGTRGVDLTGNTGLGNFTVNESSTITGVGIGVDLTNASRTGGFRYGDGSNIDADLAASTINATTPIVIAGLNGATGTYDFRDVTLVGDTSPLEVSAFFVRAGATGVGSRSDPGSLAAADASTASFIVLLDTQAGAGSFDTISGTLTLANNQSLLSFRDTDTFNVGGGAPPNVFVFNVTTGTITNPNSGSGAPLLTSADATGTVQLGGTSVIDGVTVSNTGTGAGIFANGTAGIATIRNSTISGGGAAVDIRSGALVRTVNLQNLTLANAGNQAGALLNLNGTGGTLTVTGMSNLSIGSAGGETAGLVFDTVTFDSDLATGGIQAVNAGALTIGTTGARVQGDGLSLTNVSGSLTFSDLDIANTGGTGLLVANSKANSFLLTTADGSYDTTFGTAINLDPLTVNMTVSSVTATNGAYGIQLDQVEGFFTVTGAVTVINATIAGIAVENNTGQADALDATFNGAVTINNTVGAGLSLTNNAGATIIFGGGGTGVDVVTTGGAALNASGGTLSIAGSGNSLTSGTGQTMALSGLTVGAPGINFASVSANGAATAVALTSVTAAGGGAINLGTVNLQGITSRGIDVNTALGAALSITDLDIGLNSTTAVAVDLNGAALAAGITANDFDVTNAAAAGTSIAVDLRGTTGGQDVTLGDSAVGGAAATIAGVNTGIWLDAATNATFIYGDGESAIDSASTISAATGINAAAAPAVGTYNFRDVTFGASPGLGFGIGRTWFVDSNGATGGGNGSGADGANPMTLAAAELALAATDVIVLVNNGIAISAAGSNGNDTLNLLADTQVRGFGQGPLALTLTVPSTILLSGNTINIADPTGNGAATLTTAAGASVITLGASGNHISGFILDGAPAGALRGIVDGAGATGTVIDFMTIRNFNQVNGYGIEITPSTNTTIDNVTFTGNTNDVLLNAAGSTITNVTATGATGTSITLDNATGTTTLTNLSVSGAATGLSFTNAGGTITATNVDITGAATSALTISGGTASFNFDGTSSIIQAAGGLTLNVANHSTGTLAFAGLINATSGNGMQFNNADGTYNFPGITTLNGGNAGIDIYNGATGTFAFGPAASLTHNNAGNAFVLLSGANVTFDGSITDNDGIAVEIDAHDAGTATFNGTISSSIGNASTVISIINSNGGAINFNGIMNLASTAASVVNLSGNNGSTVTFNAGGPGLDITSTTGTGMIITGGGTVNVLGSGNSITTTSGTLLSVTDTGGTTTNVNLSFASASNTSGANGIFVQRTGAGSIVGTINIAGGAITATTRGVSLNGDALNFTYGGTIATSGAASRTFEATNRTGGAATLSGNLTDTSLGISVANNTGGTINLTGQTISLNTGANTAVTLSNNTGATINFAPLAGGNGLDIVTTSGAGFSATGGGTVTVSGTGNTIQTGTGQIVNLTGVSAGAGGINFASLQSTGIVAGIAINLNNLDSVGGGAFSGGTTSVAATSGGNDGIFIGNGTAAAVSFGATTIGTGTISGDGIEINGAGNGAVTFTSVDIDNTTAHGISIIGAAGVTGAITISGGTIGAGGAGSIGGDGVNITGGSGTITVAASIAKTNNAGNIVEVSSHTGGAVTFSGTLSATGATANGILLSNNSGGTITFSGATKTLNTGATNAIQFDNNAATGAAVSFTGGNLDIDTTSGAGITGTSTTAGAGSLTIQGTNNTITSVGGIALNLVNTNIAAGGLNFLSISANGGARGIVLNTTGGAAGLTITGTGTTGGSGGLIQNITARGIELLNTALVSIANLNLLNANTTNGAAGDDFNHTGANSAIFMNGVATAVFENIDITGTIADNGITGINVSNFQLNNSLIDGAGNGAHESGIEFTNLSGTSSLTNTEIRFSETNSLDIVNTDVNLNLTLNNVIFRDTQSSGIGEGGLQFRSFSSAAGTPTTNIDIIDSDFLRIRTQAIQIIGEDDSVVSVDITNSVIDSQTGIGAGIDINGNDTSTVRFNIIGNPTIRSSGGAAINITSFISANVMGRIANNANISNYNNVNTAVTGAYGSNVRLLAQENSHLTVAVTGNTMAQGAGNNSAAVDVIAREGSARLDLTLTGNIITQADPATLAAINLQSGASSNSNIETNQIYANIANNNLTVPGGVNLLRLRVSELDNTHDPRIFLQGFVEGGAGIEDDAVATWNANGNTAVGTTSNIAVSLSGTATGPSAGTAQTPTNPLP